MVLLCLTLYITEAILNCCDFDIINGYKDTAIAKYPEENYEGFLEKIPLLNTLYFENRLEGVGDVIFYHEFPYDACDICYLQKVKVLYLVICIFAIVS